MTLWTTGSVKWESVATIGRESGTGRCVNTDPSLTTVRSLDSAEEIPVASATILRLPVPRDLRDPFVICDECGWMRWEHEARPEHCQALR